MIRKRRRKLGLAFDEQLTKVSNPFGKQNIRHNVIDWEDAFIPNYAGEEPEGQMSSWRLLVVAVIFLVAIFGLFVRLFHLQIVNGAYNRNLADNNRVQLRIIHAPRGVIYDRNGRILAENSPGFRIQNQAICQSEKPCFITRDQALAMEARNDPSWGELEIDAIRNYPFGEYASPIVGYVGQITQEELDELNSDQTTPQANLNPFSVEFTSRYRVGDRIGRAGLEQQYESYLRGTDGAEVIEVDAQGQKLRTIRRIDPIPGHNLHTSIDADLQKYAYQSLQKGVVSAKSCCGVAIVTDPNTGEVISLVNYPSYDANVFTDPNKNDQVLNYINDQNAPMLNRAIGGVYPPGSTFKIASSMAALASGKVDKGTLIEDTGVVRIGDSTFANWFFTSNGKTEGMVDMTKALQRSNDIYYYRIGEKIGEVEIAKMARQMGFGQKLGIDIPGEVAGLIPSDEWKRANYDQGWYPGDTLHMAIGQGFLLTTPLQVQIQTALIAGHGKTYKPHFVTHITTESGTQVQKLTPQEFKHEPFKSEHIQIIHEGLSLVPKSGGTAWPFFNYSVATAGKTGTAEFGDPKGKTHAWYSAYAPADDPKIVVTSLVEAGGEGSSVAAPIVKDIYTWYFNPDKSNLKSLDLVPVATESAKELGE